MSEAVTPEARELLERASDLERARPTIEAQAVLGDDGAKIQLQQIDAEIAHLRSQAGQIDTPKKLAAVQRLNEEQARAQAVASQAAHAGHFLREEVVRARRQEYYRAGVAPSVQTGRVELPASVVAEKANAIEELLGAMRVCSDDYQREAWYRQNGLGGVVAGTYDEVCLHNLGVKARHVRDTTLDQQLGLRLAPGLGQGTLVSEAAQREAEAVRS